MVNGAADAGAASATAASDATANATSPLMTDVPVSVGGAGSRPQLGSPVREAALSQRP
jgi:hypothetical protein